jgi:hypothetical protein
MYMGTILTFLRPVSQIRTELVEDPEETNFAFAAIGVYAIRASKDALISTQFELVFLADQAYHRGDVGARQRRSGLTY